MWLYVSRKRKFKWMQERVMGTEIPNEREKEIPNEREKENV